MLFDYMKHQTKELTDKIKQHAFNMELMAGTLPMEKFLYYQQQDALYVVDFSRSLAIIATRLSENDAMNRFLEYALQGIQCEQQLHHSYLKKYLSQSQTRQSLICFAYTNYLLRMANMASVEEAIASILPCFWIYQEVALLASQQSIANNPYQPWIDLYTSEKFKQSVAWVIELTEKLAQNTSPLMHKKMTAAFSRAMQLEYLFWHSAYQQDTFSWPEEVSRNKFYSDNETSVLI